MNNLALITNSSGSCTKMADFEANTGPNGANINTSSAAELQVNDSDMAEINPTLAESGINVNVMDYGGCGQNENTCFSELQGKNHKHQQVVHFKKSYVSILKKCIHL